MGKHQSQGFYTIEGFWERNALSFEVPASLYICQYNEERNTGLGAKITAKCGAMMDFSIAYDWET